MKSPDDYNTQYAIENALASLLFGDVPEELRPLADAVRIHDWRIISNAALSLGNSGRTDEVLMDSKIQQIAGNPLRFGVDELTKGDVERIMHVLHPEFPWPKDPRNLWKRTGLDRLRQGHGSQAAIDSWELNHKAEKENRNLLVPRFWVEMIKRGKLLAETRSVLSGEVDEITVTIGTMRARIVATVSHEGIRGTCIVPTP